MVPNVVRLWREHGETDCTCCRTRQRVVYTKTPDGDYGELCWPCWRSKFSARLRTLLTEAVRSGAHPDPRDGYALRRRSIEQMHLMALEAIRLRMYVQPTEARVGGLSSLEGAVRENCKPLKWIIGLDPLFDMTISKVLPKDQRPASLLVAAEETV